MQPIIDEHEVKELKDFVKHRFTEIAETFLRCSQDYVDSIVAAHGKNDAEAIVDAAHPLKSSSGNLGLKALSELSRKLEETSAEVVDGETDFTELASMVQELPELYEKTAAALKEYI